MLYRRHFSDQTLHLHMAFFGLTHLGYQNPTGDKLIVKPSGPSRFWALQSRDSSLAPGQQHSAPTTPEEGTIPQKPLPFSSEIHKGSHERYQEMIRQVKTPRSPNELYLMPVTDNQQYGWLQAQSAEPWTQVKRFPMKNSEMTRFVTEMTRTDPDFTLF
ncbi:testis-expressed protein 49-like [Boleophthalmus pectinirostris]|uniref:testis-expressed protein 49-like n=1 Tax=Boleophthalmus pectinirostris TaxID=150288 RepID=UPI00242AD44A|nr:testis-expressed protein 49-like [Boleophthalmus pectinirostris]